MTSLRLRLFAMLIATTILVWAGAAIWTAVSTKSEIERVLDRRLSEAARMVASLGVPEGAIRRTTAAAAIGTYDRQLSCQIWSLDGRAIGRSASAPSQPLGSTMTGQTGFSNRHVDGEDWRVYTLVDQVHETRVMVGDNLKVRRHLVNDLMLGLLMPALAGLAALSLLLWGMIGRGLAPLRTIARSLEDRPPDDLTPIPSITTPTELRPVVTALDGLFGRLAGAREAERSFVTNAAHELQTPLAGLATHADIARRTVDPAIRQRAIERVSESVEKMSRLIGQLLTLARQDSQSASGESSDLSAVVADVVGELAPAARRCGIVFRLIDIDTGIILPIAGERLHLAVRNLVENAVRHGPAESPVVLRWNASCRRFDVDDGGKGVVPEEAARVRRRFERGRGTVAAGSGLGLSIVDAALKGSSLDLQMRQRPGGGFQASIIDRSREGCS